jgi:hypothetical protein
MLMALSQDTRFIWWPMDLDNLKIDLNETFSLVARMESI